MIFKNFTDHLRAHMERAQSLASSESHQQLHQRVDIAHHGHKYRDRT